MLNGIWHLLGDFHRPDTDGADSLQQVDDVFFVVGKFVGVEQVGDRRVFECLFFVLVKYSFPLILDSDSQIAIPGHPPLENTSDIC